MEMQLRQPEPPLRMAINEQMRRLPRRRTTRPDVTDELIEALEGRVLYLTKEGVIQRKGEGSCSSSRGR
jgi:hypothetical protein